jgi:hypothetical protein
MNKGQAITDLSLELTAVTTSERAQEIIEKALRVTGLSKRPIIDESAMITLLQAIAAAGGPIQQLAEQIAVNGLLASDGLPTDQDAA